MEKTIRVFMDKTDWDHEVGYASDGNKVYPSEASVRRERPCSEECGIVEVEMRFIRVVRPENMDLMLEKSKVVTGNGFTRIMDGLNEALRHAKGEDVPGMIATGSMQGPGGNIIRFRLEQNDNDGVLTVGKGEPMLASELRRVLHQSYDIPKPDGGWKEEFSDEEKALLRPAAETLAMLDGNAFFGVDLGDGREWYEQYLPEAHALWTWNGSPPLGAQSNELSTR